MCANNRIITQFLAYSLYRARRIREVNTIKTTAFTIITWVS